MAVPNHSVGLRTGSLINYILMIESPGTSGTFFMASNLPYIAAYPILSNPRWLYVILSQLNKYGTENEFSASGG
jgi:hypothetical protein